MRINDPDHFGFIRSLANSEKYYREVKEMVENSTVPSTVLLDFPPFSGHYGRPSFTISVVDSEPDPLLRLRNMIQVGHLFGVNTWKRNFSEYDGTFAYSADFENDDRSVTLVCKNASQGKCKIIKETKLVEVTRFKADCHDEDLAALPAPEAAMIEGGSNNGSTSESSSSSS